MKRKAKMRINTLIDMEETMLRLNLKQASDEIRLQLLMFIRPNASLRQTNNLRKLNFKN